MEKNWNQKLLSACINYGTAVEKEKGQRKIAETLRDWEDTSRDAIIISENVSFLEILSWLSHIADKMKRDFFNALKKKASNPQEKTVVAILSLDAEAVGLIDQSALTETANLYQKIIPADTAIWLANNRPDVLIRINNDLLYSICSRPVTLKFLNNEKCHLLLNCFKDSQSIHNFSEKTKQTKNFHNQFVHNDLVIDAWNKLSDSQLLQAKNFDEASSVFYASSESWLKNLDNFKSILNFLKYDTKNVNFLKTVSTTFGDNSFHFKALVVASENNIYQELHEGNESWQELYNEASYLTVNITSLERAIITKYLD